MTDKEYKIVVQQMLTIMMNNKSILTSAIREEYEKNFNRMNLNEVIDHFMNYASVEKNESLNGKRIAVICKGNPETTMQILLAALRNNIHIKLVTLNYHIINTCLFTLYSEIMQNLKIPNAYFNYNENYLEQDIKERNSSYDKIIYIGSYFDYENFKFFCKNKKLVFWNDGNIKVLMPREEYKEEYKYMVKYSYANNIELEVYENKEEFFEEVQKGEFAIIYTDEEQKKFTKKIKPRILKFNECNFEDFKFKINDLILGLDFSVKV